MTRNLKVLGMALMAALAISAFAVPAASANPEPTGQFVTAFNTGAHETSKVTATDEGENPRLVFTVFGSDVRCAENHFEGTVVGGTTESLTLAARLGGPIATQECEAEELPATVDNNSCNLTFHAAKTDSSEKSDWSVTVDLLCGTGGSLEVTVFASSGHGLLVCTIDVPTQEGLQGVTVDNLSGAPHDITATMSVDDIEASQSGLCGNQENDDAEMHGNLTLTAENEEDEPIDLHVGHTE